MTRFTWIVAYIDSTQLGTLDRDLLKYENVNYYIPMIRILKRNFKGRQVYSDIPLLFNYGFFRVPKKKSNQVEYLNKLKSSVGAIYAWVFDPCQKNPFPVAKVTDQDIENLKETESSSKIFSDKDVLALEKGTIITLHGYPFDNLPAEILKINAKKREIKVNLLMGLTTREVKVSFENVFYTIYKDFHQKNSGDKSLDGMGSKVDKIFHKQFISL